MNTIRESLTRRHDKMLPDLYKQIVFFNLSMGLKKKILFWERVFKSRLLKMQEIANEPIRRRIKLVLAKKNPKYIKNQIN